MGWCHVSVCQSLATFNSMYVFPPSWPKKGYWVHLHLHGFRVHILLASENWWSFFSPSGHPAIRASMPWIQKLMAVEVDITNNVVAWQRPTAQQTHLHSFTKNPIPHRSEGKTTGVYRWPCAKLETAIRCGLFHTVARRDGGHWDDSKEFWVEVKWGLTTWQRNLTNTLTWLTPILLMDSFLPNWRLCALW